MNKDQLGLKALLKPITVKYGIVGYSSNDFDKSQAQELLDNEFKEIVKRHPVASIEIVSGYTNLGIPKIAYELADRYGFVMVGFSARQALSEDCGLYPVKKSIVRGEQYGDESEAFISYIDHLIRIGGGPQSKREVLLFKQMLDTGIKKGQLIEHKVPQY